MRHGAFAGVLWIAAFAVVASTRAVGLTPVSPVAADFKRDVQPIFRQHCYECHGPTQQKNGFRLDRRRDALRGGTIVVIAPGSSASSRALRKAVTVLNGRDRLDRRL